MNALRTRAQSPISPYALAQFMVEGLALNDARVRPPSRKPTPVRSRTGAALLNARLDDNASRAHSVNSLDSALKSVFGEVGVVAHDVDHEAMSHALA